MFDSPQRGGWQEVLRELLATFTFGLAGFHVFIVTKLYLCYNEKTSPVIPILWHGYALRVLTPLLARPHKRTYPHFFLNACVVVFIGFQCCHVSSSAVRKFISLKQVLSVNKSNASCVHTSRIIRLMTLITE